eukprot:TRINITY_DN7332_c0_g1_i1.p1 TRINITY_DN7332_c0_g1~~TRINITY_DN7332_c0_g1_i1.p1  ORF type:complete len:178 (+),score=76.30 TRINITY_DN7332_c0_g1_i1:185-718(+)
MSISLSGEHCEGIPKDFTLLYNQASAPMQILSEASDGKIAMEGTVEYKCDVRPIESDEYRKLVRQRKEKSEIKLHQVQSISGTEQMRKLRMAAKDPNKRVKEETVKRERMSKEDLIDFLFGLFSERKNWDLKSITERSNQPVTWLKEVLPEIAEYKKMGPLKNTFELKPEFQRDLLT